MECICILRINVVICMYNVHIYLGKNKRMVILATYENMENAMLDFTKELLMQNEQVLGRSIKVHTCVYICMYLCIYI
jgi:hypothetical protein